MLPAPEACPKHFDTNDRVELLFDVPGGPRAGQQALVHHAYFDNFCNSYHYLLYVPDAELKPLVDACMRPNNAAPGAELAAPPLLMPLISAPPMALKRVARSPFALGDWVRLAGRPEVTGTVLEIGFLFYKVHYDRPDPLLAADGWFTASQLRSNPLVVNGRTYPRAGYWRQLLTADRIDLTFAVDQLPETKSFLDVDLSERAGEEPQPDCVVE